MSDDLTSHPMYCSTDADEDDDTAFMEAPRGRTLYCADCGMEYGCHDWIDVTLPDNQWAMIQPRTDGGGVLCAGCIGRRVKALPMAEAIRAEIAFSFQQSRYDRLREIAGEAVNELSMCRNVLAAHLARKLATIDVEANGAEVKRAN